jgi:hypothetical protein
MDHHLPALLDERLYHADGQILGEVYEYGSFLQSRMYAKGLRCGGCHDPHSSRPRAGKRAVHPCAQRDRAEGARRDRYGRPETQRLRFASASFPPAGASGSQCVDCHMPARTYMVVDPRRDHSFQFRGPICRSRSARRMRATCAIPTRRPSGPPMQ